jgi:hypothetical protein
MRCSSSRTCVDGLVEEIELVVAEVFGLLVIERAQLGERVNRSKLEIDARG